MTYSFRPAKREDVSLLIGLAGGTGAGKTWSAMALATGLANGQRFAVIDTEAGRAKHYADDFQFDVADLAPPFRPSAYADAIEAADKAGYPVIVVDSTSHEHAGDGGLLDMHDEELERMGGRDSAKMAAWIKPKTEHKRFVSRLLQLRSHLILCFRAEMKVEMVKDEQGKWQIVPKRSVTGLDGWVPIAEKTLPFELTVSFLLTADAPGVPKPIKLPERLRPFFPLDKPIGEDAGRRLAEWAAGGTSPRSEPVSNGAAEEDPVTAVLQVARQVDDETYNTTADAIKAHVEKYGQVNLQWLGKLRKVLEEKVAAEPEQGSMFKAPESARA